jgi:hypothetical protein
VGSKQGKPDTGKAAAEEEAGENAPENVEA